MNNKKKYTFTGTVVTVFSEQVFPSGFTKREIVVSDDDERYPQTVPFVFVRDMTKKLDGLKQGDQVSIDFELRGHEYKGRYFCDIQGCSISVRSAASNNYASRPAPTSPVPANAATQGPTVTPQATAEGTGNDEFSDIPF